MQNLEVLQRMGKYTGITLECAVPMNIENNEGPKVISAQIVIGTPGTIKKLLSLRKLSVTSMEVLVFDEADQMLAKVIISYILYICTLLYCALCSVFLSTTEY